MIGQTLAGKYTLERLLGEGGMGAVYEARNKVTGRRVAVKVITADVIKRPNVAQRFGIEARAAGAVESLYIAQILDAGEDAEQNIPFIVMEYLVGQDLEQILQRFLGPLPQRLVIRIGAQACLGLASAHKAGVVHRDVKPANIFVAERDGDERGVKLLDFGVAKVKMEVAQTDANLTHSGNLVGSPLYMSPEQARGKRGIDHTTDIWALGIVLFEALTGRSPHADAAGMGDLILAICSAPPPSVQTAAPWVGSKLASIIMRALMMDPSERFASADEMYSALRSLSPDSIAIDSSSVVPLSDAERARVAPSATGPWIPTGEAYPIEEVTQTRPALALLSNPAAVAELAATLHADVHGAEPPRAGASDPSLALSDDVPSEDPTVVRPLAPGDRSPSPLDTGDDQPTVVRHAPSQLPATASVHAPVANVVATSPLRSPPAPPAPASSPRVSLLPMLVGIGIGGLGAIAVAAWVTTRGSGADPASLGAADPAPATSSAQAIGGPTSTAPSSSTVAVEPSAAPAVPSSSADSVTPAAGTSAIAEMFGRDSATDGEPGSIYSLGKPSGVIVLLAPEFKNRLALGGEGLTASISSSGGVAESKLSFRATPRSSTATDVIQLNAGQLAHACGKTLLASPIWDAGVEVTWEAGAKRGHVWRARGTYGGGERERFAYVLSTVAGDRDVVGCGAWNADSPELEQRVVAALKSVRLGEGPRIDTNGL